MDNAKVALQSGTISLSAEGREDFVKEVLLMWDAMVENHAPAVLDQGTGDEPSEQTPKTNSMNPLPVQQQYENVYDKVDGKRKIIAHMSGASKADRARATALVLLFGHHLDGVDQIPSEAIREACTDQGCFDTGNFAKHLKGLAEKIVMNTKAGGGYDVKLTAPGRKAAKELVEGLNG